MYRYMAVFIADSIISAARQAGGPVQINLVTE
jgi:hypothetical protein